MVRSPPLRTARPSPRRCSRRRGRAITRSPSVRSNRRWPQAAPSRSERRRLVKPGKRRLRIATAALFFCLAAYVAIGLLRPQWALQGEYARLRWLAGATEQSVRVGDHRIVYLQAGHGRTIVLLHGFTGAKENWLPLMRRLARSYRVIAPDLPGWGDSTRRPGADYGPVAQAERVRQLLQVLQGAAPAGGGVATHLAARRLYAPPTLVVGHSMGGQI